MPRVLLISVWALLLCLSLFIIAHAPAVQSDLAQFLPSAKDEQQQLLLDEINYGSGSRLLIVAISGDSEARRVSASKELVRELKASGHFTQVLNGAQGISQDTRDLLFEYRYLLTPTQDLGAAVLHRELELRLQELQSAVGIVDKQLLPSDPTAAMRKVLGSWKDGGGPASRDGVWVSRDNNSVLLLLYTRAQAFELEQQEQTLITIRNSFFRIAAGSDMELVVSGGPQFAVDSKRNISSETMLLSIVASLGVALLLWWLFRSLRVVVVMVFPLFTAIIVAVATVVSVFGSIHGITLAFGITLIGITVDYPIHFFSHLQHAKGSGASLQSMWSTLRLGVLTTAIGFSSLLFSEFQGLAQLGVFAVSGLLAAALVTRYILPLLVPRLHDSAVPNIAVAELIRRYTRSGKLLLLPLAALLLSTGYLWSVADQVWETKLSNLSPISKSEKSQYEHLRDEMAVEDSGRLILIHGDTVQQLLERGEWLSPRLDELVADKRLASYQLQSRYLPSKRLQQQRREALPDRASLEQSLAEAMQGLPFKHGLFAPFVESVVSSAQLPALNMQRLAATELGLRMDALIKQHDGGWLAYVRLTGVADEGELLRLVGSRPQWLSFLNVHQQSSQIVADYLDEALGYFYGAALIITLMLLLVHKNGYLVIKTMLPVVAAIAVSAALQVATGERLSLFHVAALLLVMGFGLDYALFSVRTPADSPLFAVTMMSLITCNISTLLVFGLLAGSEVPVLHAIGTTVSVGAFAALIFSVLMVPEGDRGGELSVARAD